MSNANDEKGSVSVNGNDSEATQECKKYTRDELNWGRCGVVELDNMMIEDGCVGSFTLQCLEDEVKVEVDRKATDRWWMVSKG